MEVAMADVADFYYYNYNPGVAAADFGWPNWSPSIGWSPDEEMRDVKEAMVWQYSDDYTHEGSSPETMDHWSSSTVSDTAISSAVETPSAGEPLNLSLGENDKGLRLIHLLSAAAEAIAGDQDSQELSKVILARLKVLLPTTASGTGMERLAAHFAGALQHVLTDGDAEASHHSGRPDASVTAAVQLLQDMSPYINFGHFTANQAIVEAVGGERRVHIVDFDIMEGAQWAPLMQALVTMKNGPPPSHVKITAVTPGRKSAAAAVQETGRMLSAFAESIGLQFSFAQCRLDRDRCFRPAALKLLKGDAVVFNCSLHTPHQKRHSPASVRSFLAGAAEVGAKLVTVVEESGNANSTEKDGFLAGFMEELQRYSAMWDALEAGFPKQNRAREMVESLVLGPRIIGTVEDAFRRRSEEATEAWSDWMTAAKFRREVLSSFNQWQARLLLGLFNEGYRVEEDAENELVLSWKTRRLVSVSLWSTSPPPPANSTGQKTT